MADDDEIDVLGDSNLECLFLKNDSNIYDSSSLVSQNSELLNCDYTIHPQWLLDRPSTNPDNWYETDLSTELDEKTQIENDVLGRVSSENCITDESGWTEKEKNLLESGIEIFGKSNVRLSQFVGSKTASEVKYYLKNFYVENHNRYLNEGVMDYVNNSNLIADVLNNTQIPASIEEVIAAVSTAKPTIQIRNQKKRKTSSSNTCRIQYKGNPGRSDVTSDYLEPSTTSKFDVSTKKTKTKESDLYTKNRKIKMKCAKFKFKTKLKMPLKEHRHIIKQKTVKIVNEQNKKSEFKTVEITTGEGLAVPICEGEEIVKLRKVDNDSDTDTEIDVEISDEELKPLDRNQTVVSEETVKRTQTEIAENIPQDAKIETKIIAVNNREETETKEVIDFSKLGEPLMKQLMSLEEPTCEVKVEENKITELEKLIHSEYFSGRPTKTPDRYLKIRNHILKCWEAQKPAYLKKTSTREGLKNCGDVNSFGRIHSFLEQIGVINFGCDQVIYLRPLLDIIQQQTVSREKSNNNVKNLNQPMIDIGSRPRIKKKFNNDGEGGYTLTHDEKGHVINTTVINEEPVVRKIYTKKPIVRLVYCRPFKDENPQPYAIKIDLSTLLMMDFHAHISFSEVMGLVAGYWIPQNNTVTINYYEPCLNIASSSTHCDMCPISQAKAADAIHSKGFDILGWFHSHPTFAPEPSSQDLETQQSVQQWIGYNRPCIGVIMSPFSLNGALIASPFRCMIVDKKINFDDQFVPYKFKVDIMSEDFEIEHFLEDLKRVLKSDASSSMKHKVNFAKPYFQNSKISHLEKFITSVRMHLAKCGALNKMTSDKIIEGIKSICNDTKLF